VRTNHKDLFSPMGENFRRMLTYKKKKAAYKKSIGEDFHWETASERSINAGKGGVRSVL